MAYVVRRRQGRWEIRQSFATEAGPRARTLVSFRVLTPEVIERAERAARGTFDRDAVIRSARRAGAPLALSAAHIHATSLVRLAARGETIRPGLKRLVVDVLEGSDAARHALDPTVAEWIGASPEERGAALVDLLGLADRLPKPPKEQLRFPGFSGSQRRP